MDWSQFLILLIAVIGTFIWIKQDLSFYRSEASADRRDILHLIRSIQEEIKDFHGRLCAIEERNKNVK